MNKYDIIALIVLGLIIACIMALIVINGTEYDSSDKQAYTALEYVTTQRDSICND